MFSPQQINRAEEAGQSSRDFPATFLYLFSLVNRKLRQRSPPPRIRISNVAVERRLERTQVHTISGNAETVAR